MGFKMVQDRDSLLLKYSEKIDDKFALVAISSTQHPEYPPKKNCTRSELTGGYILRCGDSVGNIGTNTTLQYFLKIHKSTLPTIFNKSMKNKVLYCHLKHLRNFSREM